MPSNIRKNLLKNFRKPTPSKNLKPIKKKNNEIMYDACPQKTNIKLDNLAPK